MPAYPCVQCKKQVDIRDLQCRNCGDRSPFQCSRCNKRLTALEIFNAEEITFQKPIFCTTCGHQDATVMCPNCKTDVVRRSAREDDGVLYHEDCYKTVMLQKKITPALRIVPHCFARLHVLQSSLRFHAQSQVIGIIAGLAAAIGGFFLGGLMAPRR